MVAKNLSLLTFYVFFRAKVCFFLLENVDKSLRTPMNRFKNGKSDS